METVAIAILNFNGKDHLEQFLPSVSKHSASAKIYVIDNGSTDKSVSFIRTNYPQIEIIINESNYGFAGGYNQGMASISEELVVLLNSDVEVTENWLLPLTAAMQNKTNAGCQPKINRFKTEIHSNMQVLVVDLLMLIIFLFAGVDYLMILKLIQDNTNPN